MPMTKISLKNKRIIKLLDDWNEFCFSQDRSKIQDTTLMDKYKDPYEYTITHEFLAEEQARGKKHIGFPTSMKGIGFDNFFIKHWDKEWSEKADSIIHGMCKELTAKRNALAAYYPPGGYIGWHTNWNAPGYNILLTYSETGEGWFEWQDPVTKEIHRIDDEPGWQCKVGYYGTIDEPDKVCWHAAYTDCERLTFAYMIPDKYMWEEVCEDLMDPDA